jgi:hypothetical protein
MRIPVHGRARINATNLPTVSADSGIAGEAQRPGSRSGGMKQNLGAVVLGVLQGARRQQLANHRDVARLSFMSIEAALTGHPAMASLSSPRSGCLRARGRRPASSAPRTPGPPRARGVNQLTGLSNQHTRMGKLCLAIVCFWQSLVALRRSNQPVVLGRLLSRRVLIGNKTGFFLEREVNERWRNFSRSVSTAAAILSRPSRRRI